MAFREFSGAISYCVMYKYTYTNINILNNTMSFTFIYVENLVTWMVSNKVWINSTSHMQQFYKLHPTNTTFTLSGMTTVELSSIYSHSSSRLLVSACSYSLSATTTTSSPPSTISSQHHLSWHCRHLQPALPIALYGDCSSHRIHGSCSNWYRRGVLYHSRMPRC